MVKHRRFSKKPESDPLGENVERKTAKEILSEESPRDIKSILLSGTKFVYIIATAAFLSGIFTPLTMGVEYEQVIYGMLTIFLGLAGGVVIFLGTKYEDYSKILIFTGLGIFALALICVFELAQKSFFQ